MKNHPIAVLISVYKNDNADQVSMAIDSIRNQDYGTQNIRIYLGVDGPVPEKLDTYIKKHSDYFYRIVRNETNQGLAATLNWLIDSLEDEKYAFRMDADDISLPYRFRLQIEFMEANPHVDICGGSIVEFDESGNAVMVRSYPKDTQSAKKYICKANPLAHMTVCIRRTLFKSGEYRYELKKSEDIRLWYQALAGGKEISNLQLPLVLVRMNDSMLRRRGARFGLGEFDAFLLATYSLHGLSWRLIYPFARLVTRFAPSVINRFLYRKLRWLLNSSAKDHISSAKGPIRCVGDDVSSVDVSSVAQRILKEVCGLSEKEVSAVLSDQTTVTRRVA